MRDEPIDRWGAQTIAVHWGDVPLTARRLASKLRVFHYAVSLGKQRNLLHLPTADLIRSSFHLSGAALKSYRFFAGDGMFRVSVGLEDPKDLIEDLAQALWGQHPVSTGL